MSTPLAFPCTFVYSVDLLRSLNTRLVPPSRQTRKTLFRFQLWRPAYLRRHATSSSSCLQQPRQQPRQPPRLSSSIRAATLNAHSLRKKYVPVSDFIESSELDVMVVVESWPWASIVGWTEGQIPLLFGTGWTEYALSPLLFEAHLCLFF